MSVAHADDGRARQNYLLQCAGCHGEDGRGLEGHVPSMHDTFAIFAKQPEGRAYLMRVPGVTQSTLEPKQLAEVMNWAMKEFSAPALVSSAPPFTAAEIAAARAQPLLEVNATRISVLERLEQGSPKPATQPTPSAGTPPRPR
jgi:mono/diheme cytochrome c family protein